LFSGNTELEQAKATVNNLIQKASLLGDGNSTEYLVQGSKLWSLFSFSEGNSIKQCGGERCLCICPTQTRDSRTVEICDSDGYCASPPIWIIVQGDINFEGVATKLYLARAGNSVGISKI